MQRLLFLWPLLIGSACGRDPVQPKTQPPAAPVTTTYDATSAPDDDLTRANALIREMARAVEANDIDTLARIFEVPEESKAEFAAELAREHDEISACLKDARVAELRPSEDDPQRIQIRLSNCPSKTGFCCALRKHEDGHFTVAGF